jgi:hypothetical protein
MIRGNPHTTILIKFWIVYYSTIVLGCQQLRHAFGAVFGKA